MDANTSYNLLLRRPQNMVILSTLHQWMNYVNEGKEVRTLIVER